MRREIVAVNVCNAPWRPRRDQSRARKRRRRREERRSASGDLSSRASKCQEEDEAWSRRKTPSSKISSGGRHNNVSPHHFFSLRFTFRKRNVPCFRNGKLSKRRNFQSPGRRSIIYGKVPNWLQLLYFACPRDVCQST